VGAGQIFALEPTREGGHLVLVAESVGVEMLDGPDNVAIAPWGDVVVTEDSVKGRAQNRVFGITPGGEMYLIGQTFLSELAGLCFSPDGRAMFVNVFGQGVTLVVTGPFPPPLPPVNEPTWPSDDWGEGGAGGAPDVPVVPDPPPRDPKLHVRAARGCDASPGSPTDAGALGVAVALGLAALTTRRGNEGE
jgi:hypothetical protein